MEETPLFQVNSQFSPVIVDHAYPKRPFLCSDLAGIFDDAQFDDANTLSRTFTSYVRSA